jgi:hypothetical protein
MEGNVVNNTLVGSTGPIDLAGCNLSPATAQFFILRAVQMILEMWSYM